MISLSYLVCNADFQERGVVELSSRFGMGTFHIVDHSQRGKSSTDIDKIEPGTTALSEHPLCSISDHNNTDATRSDYDKLDIGKQNRHMDLPLTNPILNSVASIVHPNSRPISSSLMVF